MKKILYSFVLGFFILSTQHGLAQEQILWELNNLENISGLPVTVHGNPKVVNFGAFDALEFDGRDDGIFLDQNPVANAEAFTLEVVFMPYAGGETEQRFVHVQQDDNNRMLVELRSYGTQWFLDTFIKSGSSNRALYAEDFKHPNESWHHAAMVYENGRMWHYVDGEFEMDSTMNYTKQTHGKTSFGMRQNFRSYYKGAIRLLRATPKVLSPEEFLRADVVNPIKTVRTNNNPHLELGAFVQNQQSGWLTLHLHQAAPLSVRLVHLNGTKKLLTETVLSQGRQRVALALGQNPSGVYLLEVANPSGVFYKKIHINKN